MPVQQLVHKHLVPALEDGLRIVHDRHAKRFRPAHELLDDALRARAVEEGVKLGQALQCFRADDLRLQSDERRRLHEPLQRFLVGGLVRFVRVPEDGQSRPAPVGALPLGGRACGHERLDRLEQERAVLQRNVRKAHGLQGIEAPASLRVGKQRSQQRRTRPREQLLGEGLVTGMLSEVDVELEALALVVMQRLLHQRLNLGPERPHAGLGLEVPDGFNIGDGALATGLGDERHVVAASLVAAGAA